MQTHLGVGGYTNGMDPELRDWPAAYHGDNYSRLQRVKATVDPAQFFDFPQAVTPR
ncbi:BBE domain-containing protein [Nannocystis sp. RBIL2]|nr:BBE domain-containing protein [Nannocystis sp. RBIL2]MCY1064464.1 BBE domain-containing protein [Nannocystis sp. RBIL2]